MKTTKGTENNELKALLAERERLLDRLAYVEATMTLYESDMDRIERELGLSDEPTTTAPRTVFTPMIEYLAPAAELDQALRQLGLEDE